MEETKMKARILIAVALAIVFGCASLSSAQEVKTKCENDYKNCVDTRKVVTSTIESVKKGEQTEYVKSQLSDANDWLKKADDLLAKQRERMDKGEYNDDVALQLGYVWRWYVEAGSGAVRALNSQTVHLQK